LKKGVNPATGHDAHSDRIEQARAGCENEPNKYVEASKDQQPPTAAKAPNLVDEDFSKIH
jgi:hypothetical protein